MTAQYKVKIIYGKQCQYQHSSICAYLQNIDIFSVKYGQFNNPVCCNANLAYLGIFIKHMHSHIPLKMAAACSPKIWEQFLFSVQDSVGRKTIFLF